MKGLFMFFMRHTIIVMSRRIEFDLKNAIYNKYEAINDRLQRNNNDRILHRTSMQDFNKIFETGKDWNFK